MLRDGAEEVFERVEAVELDLGSSWTGGRGRRRGKEAWRARTVHAWEARACGLAWARSEIGASFSTALV